MEQRVKIFISYSHRDASLADEFYRVLKSWGHETWIDYKGISAGDSWTYEIDEALNWANVTIGIMTGNAVQSSNVKKEWQWTLVYGERLQKRLVLLKIDDCIAPHYFVDIDWIDFIHLGRENAIQRLQHELEQPIEKIARLTSASDTDPYRQYLQALYEELEAELNFLVLSAERIMDISAIDSPDKVQEAKRAEKPRMLQAFSRRIAKDEAPIDSFKAGYDAYNGRLLLLGEPGAGKTITVLTHARDAVLARLQDSKQPLPLLGRIATWNASKQTPLHEWLSDQLRLSAKTIKKEIKAGNCLLLLDGLDELSVSRVEGEEVYYPRERFLKQIPSNNKIVISCRLADYEELKEQIKLNGAIILHALSDEQIRDYLNATEATSQLWEALQKQPDLLNVARNPLILSLFAFTYRDNLSEELRVLKDLTKDELRDVVFEQYVMKRYDHESQPFELNGGKMPFTLEAVYNILGYVACKLVFSYSYSYMQQNSMFDHRDLEKAIDFLIDELSNNNKLAKLANRLNSYQYIFAFEFVRIHFIQFVDSSMSKYSWEKLLEMRFSENNEKVLAFVRFTSEAKYRFIHFLLRDYFAKKFATKHLRNFAAYTEEGILGESYSIGGFNPAQVLAQLQDYKVLDEMIAIVNDVTVHHIIRSQIAESLGKFNSTKAYMTLHQLLNSENERIRQKATMGLAMFPQHSDSQLFIDALSSSNPLLQGRALQALENLSTPEALQAVRKWKAENNIMD
jgi:hypothetical protein